jgi:hypothetical protein
MRILFAFFSLLLVGCQNTPPPITPDFAFVGVNVIKVSTGEITPDQIVMIDGDRIVATGDFATTTIPNDVTTVFAEGQYLMPGLMDSYVYDFRPREGSSDDFLEEPPNEPTKKLTEDLKLEPSIQLTNEPTKEPTKEPSQHQVQNSISTRLPLFVAHGVTRIRGTVKGTGTELGSLVDAQQRLKNSSSLIHPVIISTDSMIDGQASARVHEVEVPVLTGSDSPNNCLTPGASLICKLIRMADSVLTNLEVLQTATLNPALAFTGEQREVETGQSAELILLGKNPLENLDALHHLEGVYLNGQWLDRAVLKQIKETAKQHASNQTSD